MVKILEGFNLFSDKGNALLWLLFILMVVDFISGILAAWQQKKLDSKVGTRGLPKKMAMLCIIILAAVIEEVMGGDIPLKSAVIIFYLINEGLSIIENAANAGAHIPEIIRDTLMQFAKDERKPKDETKTDSGD